MLILHVTCPFQELLEVHHRMGGAISLLATHQQNLHVYTFTFCIFTHLHKFLSTHTIIMWLAPESSRDLPLWVQVLTIPQDVNNDLHLKEFTTCPQEFRCWPFCKTWTINYHSTKREQSTWKPSVQTAYNETFINTWCGFERWWEHNFPFGWWDFEIFPA